MRVNELIKLLQKCNQNAYIYPLGNSGNAEDETDDINFNDIEVWEDGYFSVTIKIITMNKKRYEKSAKLTFISLVGLIICLIWIFLTN